MRTKDPAFLHVRGMLDVLTFPMVIAIFRWLAIAYILTMPSDSTPQLLHWALVGYGAVTTLFATNMWYRWPSRGKLPNAHPLVLPALIAIDVAYAALATKLYGVTLLLVLPAMELAWLPPAVGVVLLAVFDCLFVAIADGFHSVGLLSPAFRVLALTAGPYLVVLYLLHGRRRAESQVRAIDEVLNAGSELGAQLSLDDVLAHLQNLLGQFQRVVPWDTCIIYVVQYDESAAEEMLVATEIAGGDRDNYRGKKIAFGTGVVGYVAAKQRPALVADLHKDARQPDGDLLANARGSLVVPIIGEGQTVGCVQLVSSKVSTYSADQLGLVNRLISLASVGVRNALLHSRTRAMADTDSLTGLLTARAYHERLEIEFRKAQAARTSLSLLIIDLDRFKSINDTHGHLAGDEVLRRFGAMFREQARRGDVCCRYGGDEFIIVMPGTIKSEAAAVASRVCRTVEETTFTFERATVQTTVSIGVASYPQDVTTKQALIKAADDALYRAKQNGRNSLRVFTTSALS